MADIVGVTRLYYRSLVDDLCSSVTLQHLTLLSPAALIMVEAPYVASILLPLLLQSISHFVFSPLVLHHSEISNRHKGNKYENCTGDSGGLK